MIWTVQYIEDGPILPTGFPEAGSEILIEAIRTWLDTNFLLDPYEPEFNLIWDKI